MNSTYFTRKQNSHKTKKQNKLNNSILFLVKAIGHRNLEWSQVFASSREI